MFWYTCLLICLTTEQFGGNLATSLYKKSNAHQIPGPYGRKHNHGPDTGAKYDHGVKHKHGHDSGTKYDHDGKHDHGHVNGAKYDDDVKHKHGHDKGAKYNHGKNHYHGHDKDGKYDHGKNNGHDIGGKYGHGKTHHGHAKDGKYEHGKNHGHDSGGKYDDGKKHGHGSSGKYALGKKHGRDNRGKYDHGKKHGRDNKGKYVHGKKHGRDNRGKYDHGKKHGRNNRGKYAHGKKHGRDSSGKYDHGKKHGRDNRGKYALGKKHGRDNRGKYAHGKKHGRDSSGKYDHGKKHGRDNRGKYALGKKHGRDNRGKYDHGKKHGRDNRGKYDHGKKHGHDSSGKYDHGKKHGHDISGKYEHGSKHGRHSGGKARVNGQHKHTDRWSSWSDWGPCSVTCGSGHHQRTRSCLSSAHGGPKCYGTSVETRACHRGYYKDHKDGYFSEWSHWGSCSNDCEFRGEKNYKYRTRECVRKFEDSAPCNGRLKDRVRCNAIPCQSVDHPKHPTHKELNKHHTDIYVTDWSDWGPCSVPCGVGYRMRERGCYGDIPKHCAGVQTEQTKECHRGPCDGRWTGWSVWGPCPKPCEEYGKKNYQYRTRSCTKPTYGGSPCKGARKQRTICNKTPCSGPFCDTIDGGVNKIQFITQDGERNQDKCSRNSIKECILCDALLSML